MITDKLLRIIKQHLEAIHKEKITLSHACRDPNMIRLVTKHKQINIYIDKTDIHYTIINDHDKITTTMISLSDPELLDKITKDLE